MEIKRKNYDVAFENYSGRRRYTVAHPDFPKGLVVAAPDEVAAIAGAAKKWHVRWQEYKFYAYCEVSIYNRKGVDAESGLSVLNVVES